MKRIILTYLLVTGTIFILRSQEYVTGLFENPAVRAEYEQLLKQPATRDLQEDNPIFLPFFDDFNQSFIYPGNSRWADREAYVNSNFGYRSANVGVATLDAIDSRGKLHENASQFPFRADSLTSLPIRLDSLFQPIPRKITVADSLYLSFYYQPQGRGNKPEEFDSLILQFGYYTGDSIFTYTYDSIWAPLSNYIQEGDTVRPGDTIYSPQGCAPGLYVIADQYYYFSDLIQLPCDSVFIPDYRWRRVWATPGLSLQEFYDQYGTYSRQVMIPITDSARYFQDGFRFRFFNIASLASENNASWRSNCDQWNLDYIYLDVNRSYKDTVFRDVTFVERAPSILKNYEAMPFRQYVNDPTNEMKSELEMVITNLDSAIFNSTYYYVVYEVDGPFNYLYPGGNCNLFPVYINGYQSCVSCAAHACPPVNFLFPLTTQDSAEFEIRHYIIGDITPQDTVGDTVSIRQRFFNYYAYDDGTPEEGYGLTPAGSKLAYKFRLNVKDTLRAVQFFFNRTQNDANEEFFDLVVWRDNNGKPGDILYRQDNMLVKFADGMLGFQTYMLDEPVPVNGIFYIGWEQQTNDNLNVGFDRYNNAQQHIFYNVTGEWYNTTFQGALMMRPLLGREFEMSGIGGPEPRRDLITIYPNPLHGSTLHFKTEGKFQDERETAGFRVSVHNMLGAELISSPLRASLDAGSLKPGLYIVRITDENGRTFSVSKLVKN